MIQQKFIKLSLFFLIVLGVLIRVWRFGSIPFSLYWDEVAIGLDARSLLQTNKDINGNSWLQPLFFSYGDYKAPVYIWLVTIFSKFLSVSQFSIRLPSLLASLAIAFLLFKLIQLVSKKNSNLPLLTTISFLIMPWAIHFSRIGMESHLSLFWLVLSVYLSVLAAKKSKPLYLLFSALAISLGIYTYISLRVIAPILFIITFLIYCRSSLKKYLPSFTAGLAIIASAIFILIRSPDYQASQAYRLSNDNLIKSTTYIDKSITAQGSQSTFISRIVHHRYLYKSAEYLENYFAHFSPQFLFTSGDNNPRHHSGFGGQLLAVQGIFLILGLYYLFRKIPKKEKYLLLSWLLLSPTVSALVNEVPHASRSIYMIIPLAWIIGIGFNQLKSYKPIFTRLIVILLIFNLSLYLHDYFSHYPQRSSLAWVNPYKQTALALQDKPKDKAIYITNEFYKPELYIAFYQNKNLNNLKNYFFFLPNTCPENSWCVASPGWQPDTTTIIKHFSSTNELVVKKAL